jgi:phage/plasmid primase-like uncharacterized protein
MERNKKDLHWFLSKTSAGYMIGGEDAGQRYLESVFDAHGIDLRASLMKATGGPEIQFRVKVKADSVVFHAGKKDPNYGKVYFSVDPVPQQQGFNLPNVYISSFNNSISESITSSKEIISQYKDYMAYRKEKLSSMSQEEKRKFFAEEENNSEYANEVAKNRPSKEEIRQNYIRDMEKAAAEAEAREEAERKEKARKSIELWKSGQPISQSSIENQQFPASPYFIKKDMPVYSLLPVKRGAEDIELEGGRTFKSEFDMIPLINIEGKMVNYQKITTSDDTKKILASGLEAKGVFNVIGGKFSELGDSDEIHFAEGLSNAYYVNKISEKPTIFSLNAKNLELVVGEFREKFPDKKFVIAADNDAYKPYAGNAGMSSAIKAAIDHKTVVTYPEFTDREDTDWDDFYKAYGEDKAREAYLAGTSTLDMQSLSEPQKKLYKEVADIQYSPHKDVWDKTMDFVLPSGFHTEPSVFKKRYEILQKIIPEHTFHGQDKKDQKQFYPLSGVNIRDLTFAEAIKADNSTIKSLDENSRNFFKNGIIDYVSENQKALSNLTLPNKIYNGSNLSNTESKRILTTSGFLPQGQSCVFVTKMEELNEFKDSFYIDNLLGSYDENNKYKGKISGDISNQEDKEKKELTIKGYFKSAVVSEREATSVSGDEKLKDIMKTRRSKKVLTDFVLQEVKVGGRAIDVDKFYFDDNSLKKIKNNIFQNKNRESLQLNVSKNPDAWGITNIQIEENPKNEKELKVKKTKEGMSP